MISFIVIAIGLSFLILVHEAGHFFAAKLFGVGVDEFGFGLPPRLWGKKIGETIYSLNWLPFGGFVKMVGEEGGENVTMWQRPGPDATGGSAPTVRDKSFANQSAWRRSLIIVAGVVMNFLFGWLLFSLVLMIGTPKGVFVTDVKDNSPAKTAGIMLGDKLTGFETAEGFIKLVADQKGKETIFKIEREGMALEVKMTPRVNPPSGEGSLGIGLAEGGGRAGFFEGLKDGFFLTISIIKSIFTGLFFLFKGIFVGAPDLRGVVGPVGIFNIASHAGGLGFVYLLQLIALISINLGAINIIPFPALDGGRFLFIIFEKIKGSPLPVKFERGANGLGFIVLLLLMLAMTVRDVGNLL